MLVQVPSKMLGHASRKFFCHTFLTKHESHSMAIPHEVNLSQFISVEKQRLRQVYAPSGVSPQGFGGHLISINTTELQKSQKQNVEVKGHQWRENQLGVQNEHQDIQLHSSCQSDWGKWVLWLVLVVVENKICHQCLSIRYISSCLGPSFIIDHLAFPLTDGRHCEGLA